MTVISAALGLHWCQGPDKGQVLPAAEFAFCKKVARCLGAVLASLSLTDTKTSAMYNPLAGTMCSRRYLHCVIRWKPTCQTKQWNQNPSQTISFSDFIHRWLVIKKPSVLPSSGWNGHAWALRNIDSQALGHLLTDPVLSNVTGSGSPVCRPPCTARPTDAVGFKTLHIVSVAYRQGARSEHKHSICKVLPLQSLEFDNTGYFSRSKSHRTARVLWVLRNYANYGSGRRRSGIVPKNLKVLEKHYAWNESNYDANIRSGGEHEQGRNQEGIGEGEEDV